MKQGTVKILRKIYAGTLVVMLVLMATSALFLISAGFRVSAAQMLGAGNADIAAAAAVIGAVVCFAAVSFIEAIFRIYGEQLDVRDDTAEKIAVKNKIRSQLRLLFIFPLSLIFGARMFADVRPQDRSGVWIIAVCALALFGVVIYGFVCAVREYRKLLDS